MSILKIHKLLVMTSGGDSPGMNAAIRGVVRTAVHHKISVYGCENGFHGLIEKKVRQIGPETVANCIQRGGTILRTSRSHSFLKKSVQKSCADYLRHEGIDALVVIGGDGSFRGAAAIAEFGYTKAIGIPATIDNDIIGTDYCLGFDTARNTALDAIDKIRDTAFSHRHNFMVEVMGRDSGFLAVDVGMAGGAEFILTPEYPTKIDAIAQKIITRKREKLTSIMVVAEANEAGRSFKIAQEIMEKTGVHYRVCILGHTQRGGSPTVMDRTIGTLMGAKAVDELEEGANKKMTAMQHGAIVLEDFPSIGAKSKRFDQAALLRINDIVCG